jgi:hypothetical protein
MAENRYAVLIGCNNYPEDSQKLPALKSAEHDARGLREILVDKDIGGFDPDNIHLFTSQSNQEILMEIAKCLNEAQTDDLVFIYYSGHGKLDKSNKLHLATSNTNTDLLGVTSLPVATIKEIIDKCSSQKIVWILDCCYSGAVAAAFKGGDVDSELQIASGGKGKYIMTASTGIQVAKEEEDEEYSVFTKYLLEGLKSGDADLNGDGVVTVDELYSYVRDQVVKSGQQEPVKFALNVMGELTLAGARQPQKLRAGCLAGLFGEGEISSDEYNFAFSIVSSSEQLTDEESKLVELIDGVLEGAEPAGVVAFMNTIMTKRIEEEKKELKEQAEEYHKKHMYRKALEQWKKVLAIDSSDIEALRETEELTKIIDVEQKIKDHTKSATKYSQEGNRLDAIVEWIEVLRLDLSNDAAIKGIENELETIKSKSVTSN